MFLRCANAEDICSAAVRPRFPATSPSPSYSETHPSTSSGACPNDPALVSPAVQPGGTGAGSKLSMFSLNPHNSSMLPSSFVSQKHYHKCELAEPV